MLRLETMRILEESKRVLERHGYFVSPILEDAFHFEDDALIGFICELPLRQVLTTWSARQDDFVRQNAAILRKSSLKAWNLYSVFLSADSASPEDRKALISIEEDFHATRKIVQTEITTLTDVTRALYSFIPIQNLVTFSTDNTIRTLRTRLITLPSAAVDALLDQNKSDDLVVRAFQEAHAPKED